MTANTTAPDAHAHDPSKAPASLPARPGAGRIALRGRVEVAEIAGSVTDEDARAMEDLLWQIIPHASGLQDKVGRFHTGRERTATQLSHPLALVQLLTAYHVAKAEEGVYAL